MYSVQSFSRSCASSLPGIPHFSNKLPDNKAKKQRLFTMKGFQADKSLNVEEPLASNVSSEKHTNICKNLRKTCGVIKASAGTDLETTIDEVEKEKSEIYSSNMTTAMGAVLTYRHELGINYNFVLPDLIVGSCLQSAADVDKLKSIGVKTIFCLQQDPDLEYFGVDISSIQDHAKQIGGIQHIRAEIRDFDGFDLRTRLPKVTSILRHAIKEGQGITYIHCTAGLGRAPSVTLAYMFWVLGYKLEDASKLLLSVRPCFPKLDAIRCATADMLTKGSKQTVTLKWNSRSCASVQISGLDVGWGQMLPLSFDEQQGYWILKRELPVGFYEYKYVVDGEWTCNKDELKTSPNKDGHVNNYVEVEGDVEDKELRKRLMQDVNLTEKDRILICEKLDAWVNED